MSEASVSEGVETPVASVTVNSTDTVADPDVKSAVVFNKFQAVKTGAEVSDVAPRTTVMVRE